VNLKTLGLIALAILAVVVVTNVRAGNTRSVTPKEANTLVAKKQAVLIDVREAGELAESGTAKGAYWLPMSKLSANSPEMQDLLKKINPDGKKDKELIFFCRSGGRANTAAATFDKLGFKVVNMGGFSSWQAAGLPVEQRK